MKNRKGIVWAPILIIVATILVAGVAGYFLYQAGNTNNSENQNVAVVNQTNNNATANLNSNVAINTNQEDDSNTVVIPAGWKTYENKTFAYSISYPDSFVANSTQFLPRGNDNFLKLNQGTAGQPGSRVWVLSMTSSNGSEFENEFRDEYAWAIGGFAETNNGYVNKRTEKVGNYEYTVFDYDLGGSYASRAYFTIRNGVVFVLYEPLTASRENIARSVIDTITFADPAAGWKTYTNPTARYSIKYPPTWTATTSSTEPQMVNISPPEPRFDTHFTYNLVITPATKIDSSDCRNINLDERRSTVIINGVKLTQTLHGCSYDWLSTYFPRPGSTTEYFDVGWASTLEDNTPEYELMLQTFKP